MKLSMGELSREKPMYRRKKVHQSLSVLRDDVRIA
jgi:hypothetical protein